MAVIAEFTVPAEDFALTATLQAAPEMVVEVERVVAHEDDRVMPFFWVRGGDYEEFETTVRDDPSVRDVTLLSEYEDGDLYRAEWTQNVESLVYAYLEIGATILEATGRADAWELQMRFQDEPFLSEFREFCADRDVSYELKRLYHPSEPMSGREYGLSPKQHDALMEAFEAGYFDVPRAATMEALADELDISQQSLSKRLRRAHRNLVANVLAVNHPGDEGTPE